MGRKHSYAFHGCTRLDTPLQCAAPHGLAGCVRARCLAGPARADPVFRPDPLASRKGVGRPWVEGGRGGRGRGVRGHCGGQREGGRRGASAPSGGLRREAPLVCGVFADSRAGAGSRRAPAGGKACGKGEGWKVGKAGRERAGRRAGRRGLEGRKSCLGEGWSGVLRMSLGVADC
jgi:hypothetical protein